MPRQKQECSPIFSPEDADLSGLNWWFNPYGYPHRVSRVEGKLTAHHAVSIRKYGRKPDWSKRETIDHINGNKLDNRRENLEIVSIRENARRYHNRKGLMWTSYFSGSWRHHIMIAGKVRWKSGFATELEAHQAAKALLDAHEASIAEPQPGPPPWRPEPSLFLNI